MTVYVSNSFKDKPIDRNRDANKRMQGAQLARELPLLILARVHMHPIG